MWDLNTGKVEKVSRVIGHGEAQRSMERFKLSPCGRWMGLVGSGRKGGGIITVLDARTCQWIAEVRVEGKGGVADFDWWGDGEGMLVVGKGGEAVEWSGREKRVVARWIDEGAVGTTVAALGRRGTGLADLGGDRWAAIGSSSGIVNVYDRRKWTNVEKVPARPKPLRAFDHLTTPTSHLQFSPDGQILCMASRWKRDALRLVHLPSCTVYRNWPTHSTPLGRITAVAWAPNAEMMAIANEQGKVRLWEIRS
jgi:U3 small nucleolar RNA-associated protein 18